MRTLRSKKLRNYLYARAEGRCERCGRQLGGDWEPDHTTPWWLVRMTNVHRMQALCRRCNRKKGATVELRKCQTQIIERAKRLTEGILTARKTIAHVTPGGGKTAMGALFIARLLEARFVDRVCWVCPRLSLAEQVEDEFKKRRFCPHLLRWASNDSPLVRDENLGVKGYITTYQSLGAQPDVHRQEHELHRYLTIYDEPHHMADEDRRTWSRAAQSLFEVDVHSLLMSGTIWRHDGLPIPLVDYDENGKPKRDIVYSRADALQEKAILPIEFIYEKGWVKFMDKRGQLSMFDISSAPEKEVRNVIRTLLEDESFRRAMIDRAVRDWLAFRERVNKRARMIVVSGKIGMARSDRDYIHSRYGVHAVLAVSDDGAEAQEAIRSFREERLGDVLVTVGMAYEGLDVPDCTHLVVLTFARSTPWLDQSFNRVTRVDRDSPLDHAEQACFVYVPDDIFMQRVVDMIRLEQIEALKPPPDEPGPNGGVGGGGGEPSITPLEAKSEGAGYGTLDKREVETIEDEVDALRDMNPDIVHIKPSDIAAVLRAVKGADDAPEQNAEEAAAAPVGRRAERRLKGEIQKFASQVDHIEGWDDGTTNKKLLDRSGKTRTKMGVEELEKEKAHVLEMLAHAKQKA